MLISHLKGISATPGGGGVGNEISVYFSLAAVYESMAKIVISVFLPNNYSNNNSY